MSIIPSFFSKLLTTGHFIISISKDVEIEICSIFARTNVNDKKKHHCTYNKFIYFSLNLICRFITFFIIIIYFVTASSPIHLLRMMGK